MSDKERLEALARMLKAEFEAAPKRPKLRLVGKDDIQAAPEGMDAVARESHLRMIRSLRRAYRAYGLDLIVNRATVGRGTIDDLTDPEVVALHADLYRAIDCVRNDVPFEVAGLIGEGESCAWTA